MLRHVIMWNFGEGFSVEENAANAKLLKEKLEALKGEISDVIDLKVNTGPLPGSNMDLILYGTFADKAALDRYQEHPKHQAVVTLVRQMLTNRTCMDFVED